MKRENSKQDSVINIKEQRIRELELELDASRELLQVRKEQVRQAEEREAWLRDLLKSTQTQLHHQQVTLQPLWLKLKKLWN